MLTLLAAIALAVGFALLLHSPVASVLAAGCILAVGIDVFLAHRRERRAPRLEATSTDNIRVDLTGR